MTKITIIEECAVVNQQRRASGVGVCSNSAVVVVFGGECSVFGVVVVVCVCNPKHWSSVYLLYACVALYSLLQYVFICCCLLLYTGVGVCCFLMVVVRVYRSVLLLCFSDVYYTTTTLDSVSFVLGTRSSR